jgi:hypothetical protein
MSASASRLMWLVPALSLALGVAANLLLGAVPSERLPEEERLDAIDVLFSLGFVVYAGVGALIAARHPRNAVGWLFCAFGVLYPFVGLLWSYAMYGLYGTAGGLPAQEAAAWAFAWLGEAVFSLVVLVLLLFAYGRFLTRRWRWVGAAAVATAGAFAIGIAFDPGPPDTFEEVSNPLGIDAADDTLETLVSVASVALTALLIVGGFSLIVRYRRAESSERQRLKWFAAGAAFAVLWLREAPR